MKLFFVMLGALCTVCLGAGGAMADFKTGMEAYRAKDYQRALKEFKADKSKDAEYNLGVMYFKGQGVDPDPKKGIEYFSKAAGRGHANAAFLLGNLYDKGEQVPRNLSSAAAWYRKAADKGHLEAQFNLGMMYTNGEGVEKSPREATKWFKKAASKGHPRAGKMLQVMGEEVPRAARIQIEKEKGPIVRTPITGAEKAPPAQVK